MEARKKSITPSEFQQEVMRIERFESFINQTDQIPDEVGLRDVIKDDIHLYLQENLLPDTSLKHTTAEDHLSTLNYFYKTLVAHNVLTDNPVYQPDREEGDKGALAYLRDNDEFDLDRNAKRPFIPMERMKTFLRWINKPRIRALHMTGLKTSARTGSVVNLDLRTVHIAHPLYYQYLKEHGVALDERIRDKPDSLHIYEEFSRGAEIPNENRPGSDQGEVRNAPCKRKENNGSTIPIDTELKTALLEWVLLRPPTHNKEIHAFFTQRINGERLKYESFNHFWAKDMAGSVRRFGRENALERCPDCGGEVVKKNPKEINPGRHYDCQECGNRHWRSIMWEGELESPQKFVFHCNRTYFSDAHRHNKSEITDNEMSEVVRKYKIRGDAYEETDADRKHYDNPENLDWEKDVREPYLDAIYKFNTYQNPIPAVGEGWKQP
jgi:predicted RNA-binding Zn-ribbon protein involved in translation (DUF1610 family)